MDFHEAFSTLLFFNKKEKHEISLEHLEEIIEKFNSFGNFFDTSVTIKEHIIIQYSERAFSLIKKFSLEIQELNISEKNDITELLGFIISIAVIPNLIKGIGPPLATQHYNPTNVYAELLDEEQKYKNMSYIISGIVELIQNCIHLRPVIIKIHIRNVLSALYQLCYAPLQKPNTVNSKTNFKMTEQFYNIIMNNHKNHYAELNFLLNSINKVQLYQNLMIMLYRNDDNIPPLFFRKVITKQLGVMLTEKEGLKCLIKSFIPDDKYDSGTHWNNIYTIVKLIKTKQVHLTEEEYYQNMSLQIFGLLQNGFTAGITVNRITALACISDFFKSTSLQKYCMYIMSLVTKPLDNLVEDNYQMRVGDEVLIENSIDCLHFGFIFDSQVKLDISLLNNITNLIFNICLIWPNDAIRLKAEDLFYLFLTKESNDVNNKSLDKYFDKDVSSIIMNNVRKYFKEKYCIDIDINIKLIIDKLIALFEKKKNEALLFLLFISILQKISSNISDISSKLIFGKALSVLSEKSSIQSMLIKKPFHIVAFLKTILRNKTHINDNEIGTNDNIIMCLILLNSIIPNCDDHTLNGLKDPLHDLKSMNISNEVNYLLEEVEKSLINHLNTFKGFPTSSPESSTRYGKALNDICDPLLPVRAHGLMEFGKLFEEEDFEVIAKRHYVLCVLQENLKHEDSYIYLSAIKSLSCMAKVCPTEAIESLTQEYLSSKRIGASQEKQLELRLKVGEVLVKIIATLDKEKIHGHKSVLLNTFLEATHDEDFLIRSSGFSNLGELCKILSTDLGAEVIAQILHKVEFCIDNEKSPEVRRSSILLCTQLLRGLQTQNVKSDNIALLILKPALMPLLRALKKSYENNKDDTLKLHAQLAIEELENVVKDYLKFKLEEK